MRHRTTFPQPAHGKIQWIKRSSTAAAVRAAMATITAAVRVAAQAAVVEVPVDGQIQIITITQRSKA